MIVKTGANYQAEGGYIEASKGGGIFTIDGVNYNNKYGLYSVAKLVVVNSSQSPITIYAAVDSGGGSMAPVMYARVVSPGTTTTLYAFCPGNLFMSGQTPQFDSERSSGCSINESDSHLLTVLDIDATAYFI